MKQEGTNFRIYADGGVVHQDDFEERDNEQPFCDDHILYFIPDAILTYLEEAEENPRCSFCNKTKKEVGTPIITGENASICYKCIAINKKKLDKEEGK